MPCLASFFDAMSGVKKLAYFHVGDELLASIVLFNVFKCFLWCYLINVYRTVKKHTFHVRSIYFDPLIFFSGSSKLNI